MNQANWSTAVARWQAFSAILLVGALPGLGGLLAVGLASAACVALGVLLARQATSDRTRR